MGGVGGFLQESSVLERRGFGVCMFVGSEEN